MTWFVKQRRAQSTEDFETWIEGGVSPTLNAFDNTGDSRATIIVFDNSYRDGLRIQKGDTVNTLSAKMGTGGNNVPFVAQHIPVLMRQREGKPGGGKGPLLSENMSLTLAGGNDQVLFDPPINFIEEDTMQVRRLTPIECERLMGWDDNHTLHRADGKQNADTTRYKMCGNGVASPVAQWIGQHLMEIHNADRDM